MALLGLHVAATGNLAAQLSGRPRPEPRRHAARQYTDARGALLPPIFSTFKSKFSSPSSDEAARVYCTTVMMLRRCAQAAIPLGRYIAFRGSIIPGWTLRCGARLLTTEVSHDDIDPDFLPVKKVQFRLRPLRRWQDFAPYVRGVSPVFLSGAKSFGAQCRSPTSNSISTRRCLEPAE